MVELTFELSIDQVILKKNVYYITICWSSDHY